MSKTDIKSLSIFGGSDKGIEKIKEHYDDATKSVDIIKHTSFNESSMKGVGAPIKKYDRVYATQYPLKLSALLNAMSRNLVEKYETELTRDELLRKALDEYIKQNLSLEDKQELYNAVLKDLDIFRSSNKTIPEKDRYGKIVRTAQDIENETADNLRSKWGITK